MTLNGYQTLLKEENIEHLTSITRSKKPPSDFGKKKKLETTIFTFKHLRLKICQNSRIR